MIHIKHTDTFGSNKHSISFTACLNSELEKVCQNISDGQSCGNVAGASHLLFTHRSAHATPLSSQAVAGAASQVWVCQRVNWFCWFTARSQPPPQAR